MDSVEKVNTVVHGIIEGLPIPFPLPNPDGCKETGLECPLVKGKTYSYATVLPVRKSYPKVRILNICFEVRKFDFVYFRFLSQISLDVKWELQNEKGESIICVMIPAKIE